MPEQPEPHPERRDLRARAARDRLSELLSLKPGQIRTLTVAEAELLVAEISRRLERQEDAD